jgi:hypothetical protein
VKAAEAIQIALQFLDRERGYVFVFTNQPPAAPILTLNNPDLIALKNPQVTNCVITVNIIYLDTRILSIYVSG